MPIAILDPFSGIAGDMTLGALLQVGLDAAWLRTLPDRLGLVGVAVEIREVIRGDLVCAKVDFAIPPQPHGRGLADIRALLQRAAVPTPVAERADRVFTAIAEAEGEIHGVSADAVHLHEVGAVDAVLDVVGTVWGLAELGIAEVYCGPLSVGDGFVKAAHGVLPVPAPATLKLLEGHVVRPGPAGAGELVTPTGAGLVRILSLGPPPAEFIVRRSGYGAGTKDFTGRANALRIVLADHADGALSGAVTGAREALVLLAADVDDMTGEYLAAAADALRAAGALDVVLQPTQMKKGRPGTRVEVLASPERADALEAVLFASTTTIGIRRSEVRRRALPRESREVRIFGHVISVKLVTLPAGGRRAKPEFDDVQRVAGETGRPASDIFRLAADAAERLVP